MYGSEGWPAVTVLLQGGAVKRKIIWGVALVVAMVPATVGLVGNDSFSRSVPVRVPNGIVILPPEVAPTETPSAPPSPDPTAATPETSAPTDDDAGSNDTPDDLPSDDSGGGHGSDSESPRGDSGHDGDSGSGGTSGSRGSGSDPGDDD